MRVKSADNLLTSDESSEAAFSDEYTTWIMPFYNEDTSEVDYFYYGIDKEWHIIPPDDYTDFSDLINYVKTTEKGLLPADIYYNKAGFNPKKHYKSSKVDRLTIQPTGYSETPMYKNG
jgi:hypothetical protein